MKINVSTFDFFILMTQLLNIRIKYVKFFITVSLLAQRQECTICSVIAISMNKWFNYIMSCTVSSSFSWEDEKWDQALLSFMIQ